MIQKPLRTPCVLNRSHPHAKGLKASYLANDYGCANMVDYYGENTVSLTGTSWGDEGLVCTTASHYGLLTNTSASVVDSDCGTISMYFKSYSAITDGVAHSLFGQRAAVGDEGDFIIVKQPTNVFAFGFDDNVGVHYVAIANTDIPNWQTGSQITVQWDTNNVIYDNKNLAINIDGEYKTPSASVNATSWNSFTVATNLSVLNDYEDLANRFANGVLKYMHIWDYVVPVGMLKDIKVNPYSMYET